MPAIAATSVLTRSRLRTSVSLATHQRDSARKGDGLGPAPEPDSALLKVARGYEHERQRALKHAKTERVRERKERYRRACQTSSRSCRVVPHGKQASGRRAAWRDEDENVPPDVEEEREVAGDAACCRPGYELDIAALIKPAKARKSRDGDFEVVAHVRSVIVLDDQISDDCELDEPWEYIFIEDEREDKPAVPSYAQILSKA